MQLASSRKLGWVYVIVQDDGDTEVMSDDTDRVDKVLVWKTSVDSL